MSIYPYPYISVFVIVTISTSIYEYLSVTEMWGVDCKSNPYRIFLRSSSNPKSADSINLTVPALSALPFPSPVPDWCSTMKNVDKKEGRKWRLKIPSQWQKPLDDTMIISDTGGGLKFDKCPMGQGCHTKSDQDHSLLLFYYKLFFIIISGGVEM